MPEQEFPRLRRLRVRTYVSSTRVNSPTGAWENERGIGKGATHGVAALDKDCVESADEDLGRRGGPHSSVQIRARDRVCASIRMARIGESNFQNQRSAEV